MTEITALLFFGLITVGGLSVAYWLLFVLPYLGDDRPRRATPMEPERGEPCADGLCLPSRINQITGMHYAEYRQQHAAETQAGLEETANSWRYGAAEVGSSLEDSRRELSAEDAARILGLPQMTYDEWQGTLELPAGDDYVDTEFHYVGEKEMTE